MKKQYIAFNKPYDVLSQFTSEDKNRTLAEFGLPPEIYACGRLDKNSEGLLLLTNDGDLIHQLLDPKFEKEKTYLVQIEGQISAEKIGLMKRGLSLKEYKTLPCQVSKIEDPALWERTPPIRARKSIPTEWIEMKIKEGKNHQVRKMTAHMGHPTLRLIRVQIGDLKLENLLPGQWREVQTKDII